MRLLAMSATYSILFAKPYSLEARLKQIEYAMALVASVTPNKVPIISMPSVQIMSGLFDFEALCYDSLIVLEGVVLHLDLRSPA